MPSRRLHSTRKLPRLKRLIYDQNGRRIEYYRLQTALQNVAKFESNIMTPLQASAVASTSILDTEANLPGPSKGSSIFVANDFSSSNAGYMDRKRKLLEGWERIRLDLITARIEEMCPATTLCSMCDTAEAEVIKCSDCGPTAYFCSYCCKRVHKDTIFHEPLKWNGTMYVPVIIERNLCRKDGHDCGQQYTTSIFVVDMKGTQHQCTTTLCRCEDPAVTFLRYGLWPATPTSPKIGFDLNFMELLSVLQLECHMPARTFCDALGFMRSYMFNLSADEKNIYRAVVGDCLAEYNFHRSSLNTRHLICDVSFGRDCPICQKEPPLVSMDGNFGLVHKSSSGIGHDRLSSRNVNTYFQNHDDLKKFMDVYVSDRKTQSVECSNFQAGNVVRSKIKNNKLDVTGVFGSVCKHDIPLLFVDMSHGERLGYPVYLLNRFLEDRTEKLTVMYDIACALDKHLKKNNNVGILQMCRFAVPVFHSFAHNVSCQLTYGQRFAAGTGLTDGEGIERLWSYLRGFKKITKEMTINNRQDLLSEAMLHHSKKIIWKLAYRLKEKRLKAGRIIAESNTILDELLAEEMESVETVDKWFDDWKVRSESQRKQALILSADEKYAQCLRRATNERHNLETTGDVLEREIIAAKIKRTENECKKLQKKSTQGELNLEAEPGRSLLAAANRKGRQCVLKKLKDLATERQYLSTMMKKYADGQGIGFRVSRQFGVNSSKIRKELDILNTFSSPEIIEFSTVSSPLAIIYNELDTVTLTSAQQKAVEARSMQKHAEEELVQIKSEINSYIMYLHSQSENILNTIHSQMETDSSRFSKGKIMYLYNQHFTLEQLWDSCNMLQENINSETNAVVPQTVHEKLAFELLHNNSSQSEDEQLTPETLNEILGDINMFENAHVSDEDESDDEDEIEEVEDTDLQVLLSLEN